MDCPMRFCNSRICSCAGMFSLLQISFNFFMMGRKHSYLRPISFYINQIGLLATNRKTRLLKLLQYFCPQVDRAGLLPLILRLGRIRLGQHRVDAKDCATKHGGSGYHCSVSPITSSPTGSSRRPPERSPFLWRSARRCRSFSGTAPAGRPRGDASRLGPS
jgi:hypothetical protein